LPAFGCSKKIELPDDKQVGYELRHAWEYANEIGEKGPEDTPYFLKLAKSQNVSDRRVAMYFIGELGDIECPGAVETLDKGLDDADSSVRYHALYATGTNLVWILLPKVRDMALKNANEMGCAESTCLGMLLSPESISVVKELLRRKDYYVKWREEHPNDKEDACWWAAQWEISLLWGLEQIQSLKLDDFLSKEIDTNTRDWYTNLLLLYAMAWTADRTYLRNVLQVLQKIRDGEKVLFKGDMFMGAIHALRHLATYEEARPFLEPLSKDPSFDNVAKFALRYLKWKSEKQKKGGKSPFLPPKD
jgi:hypothetical protein